MRVAYFTPLQPVHSGISDYNEELAEHLIAAGLEIEFVYEKYRPTNPFIKKNCTAVRHTMYPANLKKDKYDLTVYHPGNNVIHSYMYDYILNYPGVVVLHDYVLHHARMCHYVPQGNLAGYIEEMNREGYQRLGTIIASGMGSEFLYYLFPLNRQILDTSKMAIVHNSYLAERIMNDHPDLRVRVIEHHAQSMDVSAERIKALRKKLQIPEEALVIATFGFMNEMKKIDLIAGVLRKLMPLYPDLYYLICGEDKEGIVRLSYFDYPGIREKVIVSGYIEDKKEFIEHIALSDIILNLRWPTAGETSGVTIRAMAQGRVVVMYDHPTLVDFPDRAIARLPLQDDFAALEKLLGQLIKDRSRRKLIGKIASQYTREYLSRPRIAEKFIHYFKECITTNSQMKRGSNWIDR